MFGFKFRKSSVDKVSLSLTSSVAPINKKPVIELFDRSGFHITHQLSLISQMSANASEETCILKAEIWSGRLDVLLDADAALLDILLRQRLMACSYEF